MRYKPSAQSSAQDTEFETVHEIMDKHLQIMVVDMAVMLGGSKLMTKLGDQSI